MTEEAKSFCERSIAYIKPELPSEGTAPVKLSAADSPVFRSLRNGLLVAYLSEQEGSFAYVQNRHLAEDGLTEDQLHAIALDNLSALANDKLKVQAYGNVYTVFLDGNFEASLMLVDWIWDKGVVHTIKNDFVAALPARDIFAYCDSSSQEGIAELRDIIARVGDAADHAVSQMLYRRQGAKWLPYHDA